jgi:SIR2-like domain
MDQADFIRRVSEAPGMFAWLLGAGASQSAGLPTATDVIWDLKRRYYCSEEQQEISANDLQNSAIREKIDAFMVSRGFPDITDPAGYSRSFELIFGEDHERQRNYLQAILSEKNSSLTLGHRAFAGMIASGVIKTVFTTNFDTVIERALAEVAGKDIAAFHLEGSYAAKAALNNDQFPLYCKLHGDFRYTSLKNLTADLLTQNVELGDCLVSACNRFGLIVVGYSGRDDSIMQLLRSVLEGPNPFPHGIYWMGLKGRPALEPVSTFLELARAKGVRAEWVEIETFDSLLSRMWKQLPDKNPELVAKIGRTGSQSVVIPLARPGTALPILRMNALPVSKLPTMCFELSFSTSKEWSDLHAAETKASGTIVCTKGRSVLAWGSETSLRHAFGEDLQSLKPVSIEQELYDLQNNLHLKGFVERGIGLALMRSKPLLFRTWRGGSVLILDRAHPAPDVTKDLKQCTGELYGRVPNLTAPASDEHPKSEEVWWAEAIKLDLEVVDGKYFLLLKPVVWIWPKRARILATDFLDRRGGGRFNKPVDALLSAWVRLLLPTPAPGVDLSLAPLQGELDAGHPHFAINGRTAFSRRAVA